MRLRAEAAEAERDENWQKYVDADCARRDAEAALEKLRVPPAKQKACSNCRDDGLERAALALYRYAEKMRKQDSLAAAAEFEKQAEAVLALRKSV